MARTGRRPGQTQTRDDILAAARNQFAARGYGGATIRGIAAEAGVNPALVHHFFGSKDQVFVAALNLPFNPATAGGHAADGAARADRRADRAAVPRAVGEPRDRSCRSSRSSAR